MKKIILGLLGILGIILLLGLGRGQNGKSQINNNTQSIKAPSPMHYELHTTNSRSLFIPYWSTNLRETDADYDSYYYFGIAPNAKGEIENDAGLSNLPMVVEKLKSKAKSRKKLVLRMLDASVTDVLLVDANAQKRLLANIDTILEQYNFSGIILDLEVSFSFQSKKKGQISQFVQQICTGIKSNYKTCDVLVYGDFSYRGRPYDLGALGQVADKIILMAYDFHKAAGEPGPNYSFNEREKYGYDFKQMIADAIAYVPKEKIEVVFGMFGYDWTMNEQGKPLKSAQALSLNEINLVTRNLKLITQEKLQVSSYKLQINSAKEKYIEYVDIEGRSHIIWYEDEESAAVKTEYLQQHGVSQVSFWAHSYF